ncbi:MAG: histone deacetylase [Chloroflexi bacterium]|nr:histone deacetylase [Chloroflexota bacterium]
MKAFYCDHFVLPLPDDHRFPMLKYSSLRERVAQSGLIAPDNLYVPDGATDEQLTLVHTPGYLDKVKHGGLSTQEIRRIGFPWSSQLVERSRRSVGGTISAARTALEMGRAVNLAGGTHHAFPDHGEGFCVFNDAAVAARTLQAEGMVKRVAILDCDVHQGNGTAACLEGDASIFTFSIHCAKNFPFRKHPGDLDISLPEGTQDEQYLQTLRSGLYLALKAARADLAIYLAGADPYHGDRLGKLALSKEGLAERDRMIYAACARFGLPVATVMAGGYARDISDIVDIHFQTIAIAANGHV